MLLLMLRRLLIFFILCGCMLSGFAIFLAEKDWVDFSSLDAYQAVKPSVILDDEGMVLARFQLDKRTPVSYDKFPAMLVNAFVATEDHGFFKHHGISFRGIIRSLFVNLYHKRTVQGASTITQQLARSMFLSHERTWSRKIKEAFIALQLERQLSKQQIMELYLNNIYFGRGIYGVEAACQRMWNKSLQELTIDQAASLAAVAASARLYSPLNAPANALKRRNMVLRSMKKLGYITPEEYTNAVQTTLQIQDYAPGNPMRLYIQEWIRIWAENRWGKDALYRNGMKIKTTINVAMQANAEEVFSQVVHQLRERKGPELNGGMMSIAPETGHIKVMIGGYDFRLSQFNRAMQAYRQVGSTFKPILYALAMKAGIGMDTVYVDEPFELEYPAGTIWRPMNWDNKFHGPMTLVRALTTSSNIIAIKLLLDIGGSYVVPWSKPFGITRALTPYPSAALGTAEATVEENVAAFNVFANNGVYVKPKLIEWVKNEHGVKIWQPEHVTHRVLDSKLNARMVNLLSHRMMRAKKYSRDGWFDADSIGKTGSTNGAATTWFVGATPTLTTALYIGRDDNKPMGLLAGRTTVPIWTQFYKSQKFDKKNFHTHQELREITIDWITGQPVSDRDDPNVIVLLQG